MGVTEETSKSSTSKKNIETFYSSVRALAVVSKFMGAFPLHRALKKDGRNLRHSWFSFINLWDLIAGFVSMMLYVEMCNALIDPGDDVATEDKTTFAIWLSMSCYVVVSRGIVQFILVHAYARRLPALFTELEEYYHGIGKPLIKVTRSNCCNRFLSIIWCLAIIIFIQATSYLFFRQLDPQIKIMEAWPASTSYMLANIWQELPMNMFTKICVTLKKRFYEIRDELKSVREKCQGKDVAKELEVLRLQHAALTRVISHMQRCYGLQVAINLCFMVLDAVLQLFVFFIITESEKFLLLALAFYHVFMGFVLLAIVDCLERTDEAMLEEIAAFEVYASTRDQQLQIQLFTAQLTARPVRFSAAGFFLANNAMLCTILGAVATYLVMMVQFAPYINAQWGNYTHTTDSIINIFQ